MRGLRRGRPRAVPGPRHVPGLASTHRPYNHALFRPRFIPPTLQYGGVPKAAGSCCGHRGRGPRYLPRPAAVVAGGGWAAGRAGGGSGGSGAGGLELPLVDVLQGGGDGPHVHLDAASPVLHVADLLPEWRGGLSGICRWDWGWRGSALLCFPPAAAALRGLGAGWDPAGAARCGAI